LGGTSHTDGGPVVAHGVPRRVHPSDRAGDPALRRLAAGPARSPAEESMNMWGPEMAPHTPHRSGHPGGAGAPLGIPLRPEMTPHTPHTPQRSARPGGAGACLEIPRGLGSA